VLVSAGLGATYVLVRTFEQLTEAFVVGFFPFYMLAVGAVYVYRRRGEPRPFAVPGYPVTPAIFLAGATALIVGAASHADATAVGTFAIVLAGLPLGRFLRPRAAAV
jgi:APA family basic amino acid/polyamine antiporter